jgi:hypothetical protein
LSAAIVEIRKVKFSRTAHQSELFESAGHFPKHFADIARGNNYRYKGLSLWVQICAASSEPG